MGHRLTFRIGHEGRSWDAMCDEIPGYLLVAGSLEELRADIAFGLREVLEIEDAEIIEIFEESSAELTG